MNFFKASSYLVNLVSISLIILTIFIHIFAIYSSDLNRTIIYEPDDNYHQIIKSSNLKNCYLNKNKCIGNESIYKNSKKNNVTVNIDGLYTHTILVEYHLFKSLLINVFNSLFFNYENSQKALTVTVTSFLIIIGYMMINSKFGQIPSLFFLLINLPFVSIKYGYHFSHGADDLSAIFCLIALYLTNRSINIFYLLIIFIIFLMAIFSHPIGLFLVSLTLIYEFLYLKKINSTLLIKLTLFILSITLYFIFKFDYYEVDKNIFTLYNEVSILNLSSILNLLLENFKNNLYFFYDLNNLVNYLLIITLCIFYIVNFNKINNKYPSFLPFLIVIILFVVVSMFHPQPFTSLLTRMQVILFIMIGGISSVLIFELLSFSLILDGNNSNKIRISIVSLLIISFIFSIIYNTYNLNNLIKSNQENLNLTFDDKEIINVLNKIDDNKIFFLKEEIDESVFNSILYKFFYLGGYNKNLEIISNKKNIDYSNNEVFYIIEPSIMLKKRYNFKNKVECNIKNYLKCINLAWYNPERIFNSDFLIKNNDKLTFNNFNRNIMMILSSDYEYEVLANTNYEIIHNETSKKFIFNTNKKDLRVTFKSSVDSLIKMTSVKYENNLSNLYPLNKFYFIHESGLNKFEYSFNKPIFNNKCQIELYDSNISYEIFKYTC